MFAKNNIAPSLQHFILYHIILYVGEAADAERAETPVYMPSKPVREAYYYQFYHYYYYDYYIVDIIVIIIIIIISIIVITIVTIIMYTIIIISSSINIVIVSYQRGQVPAQKPHGAARAEARPAAGEAEGEVLRPEGEAEANNDNNDNSNSNTSIHLFLQLIYSMYTTICVYVCMCVMYAIYM